MFSVFSVVEFQRGQEFTTEDTENTEKTRNGKPWLVEQLLMAITLRLNDTDNYFTRSSSLLFAIIVALYIAARLWLLTASCLWFDEIFTVHAARHSWKDLWHFVGADIIHPPLFYALAKVWISIGGESLLCLRGLPALISVATIIPFVLLCRELRLSIAELNLALLLMSVNGYLIKYAQELRMYSLLLFLTVCSLWLFVKFVNAEVNSRKQLLALFAINLLLVYTHYYGWIVVVVEVVALLLWWRSKLLWFLVAVAAVLLCFSLWIYNVTIAMEPGHGLDQNIGWVARPQPKNVAQFLTMLSAPFFSRQSSVDSLNDLWNGSLTLVLFGLPLLALLWQIFGERRNKESGSVRVVYWLLLVSFLPIVLVFLLSWVLPHSIWGTRHLIVTSAPASILAAMALTGLRPRWLRTTSLLLIGCWFFVAGTVLLLRRPPTYIWCAWDNLAQQMIKSGQQQSNVIQVYAFEDLIAYHLWFALDTAKQNKAGQGSGDEFKVVVQKGVPGLREDPAYFLPRRFSDIEVQNTPLFRGDQIWVAFRDREWNETLPPLSTVAAQGYQVGRVFEQKAQGQRAFLVQFRRK